MFNFVNRTIAMEIFNNKTKPRYGEEIVTEIKMPYQNR